MIIREKLRYLISKPRSKTQNYESHTPFYILQIFLNLYYNFASIL